MTEITIVSAFFSIGRENYKKLARTDSQYIDYFKRWARIKNNLIFFCEKQEIADEVKKIRAGYGLPDNMTKIIMVEDMTQIEPEILSQMKTIENSEYFKAFRLENDIPENKAMYNYVVFLKSYCIFEAQKYVDKECKYLAWVDFGFEHGGEAFADENDYVFEWKYDFQNKITVFYIEPCETRPIFEVCRTVHPDSVMAAPHIVPTKLASIYYETMKKSMNTLLEVGLMDDDQLILLMSARKNPEYYQLWASNWFLPIRDYGGQHIKLKTEIEKPKLSFFQRVKRKLKNIGEKILHK